MHYAKGSGRIMQSPETLPATGFLRLRQIIPGLIPIGKTSWWKGVKNGLYPQSVKIGPRTTAWPVEDIRALIARLGTMPLSLRAPALCHLQAAYARADRTPRASLLTTTRRVSIPLGGIEPGFSP